ncbi:MAG: MBL fold metallo-hydrolase [Pseudomonadota bacterium]
MTEPRSTGGISRRGALRGLGAGAAALAAAPAFADAPMAGVRRPQVYRAKLGGFEVTAVLDGALQRPDPHKIFGEDQSPEAVGALLQANFLPTDQLEIGFTPILLNTGEALILFDAGNGALRRPNAGALRERLAAAGYAPDQIDIVALTHFHPDHIGGLMEEGAPAFPNARYVAPAAEFDFWLKPGAPERVRLLAESNVKPLAPKMTMIEGGQDVVSGVTAVAAHGHTPGHTIYHIESEGRRLILVGDTANHYVASLQRPDWHVRFDMDKAAAAATRKAVFDMIAAERIPFTGYHMPFPSIGYVRAAHTGYRYIAASYQLNF